MAHWQRRRIGVVVAGCRDRTRVEVIFVELERPLTMRAKEGRTAGPEIGSEASGAVADCYL